MIRTLFRIGIVILVTTFTLREMSAAHNVNAQDSISEKRAHAHALLQKVLMGQRFLESLDALAEIDLPIGVVQAGGAFDYTILIDRMEFTREGAIMDVYVSLALPQTGARLAFHGKVPLSAEGGVGGNARVFLLGDHTTRFGPEAVLTVKGKDRSYVEFDCNGFLGVNLEAELRFSTERLRPEDEEGNILENPLTIGLTTYTQSLNDILVGVTIPPFQVSGLRGFGFRATEAYLDWSDLSNPDGLTFPPNYTSPFLEAGLDNLWHGIYIKDLQVRFPPAFARQHESGRITIGARQMIIDDAGLTGTLYAERIFQDGNMNGWAYSLERAALHVTGNRITGCSFEGELAVPVIRHADGKSTRFRYTAERSPDEEYIFSVAVTEDELKLELWMADLKLTNGSRVIVSERDNRFYPSAHLNGELTINTGTKGLKASFNSIRFENMVIASEPPYFRPGTFGFGREGHHSSLSRYPVVFDNIGFKSEDNRVGIAFDLLINLGGGPEEGSFAGKGALVVWGIQEAEAQHNSDDALVGPDRNTWKFDKVELSRLRLNIRKPGVIELAGDVRFFDGDPVYGEGFKGRLSGRIQTITVEAEALFGRTEAFRYWYADALVELKTGVPIVPGVLSAFGFGGGYYSRMKQSDKVIDGTLGRAPSGLTYVPDENTVGIRAIVLIGTARPEAMRGDVALEVSLNRHGGINSTTFTGNAKFMSAESLRAAQIKELASAAVAGRLTEELSALTQGQVSGSLRLHFDNINDVFHGNMEIYVNVAGGLVRGISANNKAGWAVLHFEKHNWYIHIGTPDQPLGLEVARVFKSASYFMLGRNLPGSPPPPQQVSEILGDINLDYMRDINALESGTGIAFGLHFTVDTGDLRFLMFYGRFSAGTGLDFMLKNYGERYQCAERTGPIGIDGWYANGQAYAFVTGKIGIRVNLRFYKGKYEILNIGAAAILQAKGPNPFWMKGHVGGRYRILGGLIKGRCNFEITVGKECVPVAEENLLEEINMIAGITPAGGSKDVSVFNTPQVIFNGPVGEAFVISDMENNTHYFRAVLNDFTVTDGARPLDGKLIWNEERDVVVFDATDVLPGNRSLKAAARLSFEERIDGVWIPVYLDHQVVFESVEAVFETGDAPDFIPAENVAYAYPARNHLNFYPTEYPHGFIQLQSGQPYLFDPKSEWTQRVRITDIPTGVFFETAPSYDPATRRISFTLPQKPDNNRAYRLEIIDLPNVITQIDANVKKVDRALDGETASVVLTTQAADGNLDLLENKTIYTALFRTSRYDTFVEKMKRLQLSSALRLSTGVNIFQLISYISGDEVMDETEAGQPGDESFIRMEAILDGNTWYQRYVYPLLYQGYPLLGWMTVRRDPHLLGIPPVRDIHVGNVKRIAATSSRPFTDEHLVYNLGQSVASDFYDLQRHAVNYVADHGPDVPPRIRALVVEPLPYVRYGQYRIRLNYVIPGINQKTSDYEIEIFNRIPDSD